VDERKKGKGTQVMADRLSSPGWTRTLLLDKKRNVLATKADGKIMQKANL
jgi:hypothetical protein